MAKHKPGSRKSGRYERPIHSYDRRRGQRMPNPCILVVCEGAETEPNYFESLRSYLKLSTIQVRIKERAGAPISLVDEAQAEQRNRARDIREKRVNAPQYDEIWCVFDVENPHANTTFEQAVQKADRQDFKLAISNPAFEFWYVLHFEETTRPFQNGVEIKEYLKRHLPDYDEAGRIFDHIYKLTGKAIQRAKKIYETGFRAGDRFPNPSTQVYLLVGKMIDMSPSGREHFKN